MTRRYINSGQSNFKLEYIGEFETEFNKFIEYESGAQVGSTDRKKQRAKISCFVPLTSYKKINSWLLLNIQLVNAINSQYVKVSEN